MTIATTTNRVDAPGNGSATAFSFAPVVIFDPSNLQVTVRNSAGAETSLTQGAGSTNYSVVVTSYPGTGSIIYPASGGTALPSGSTIVIKRIVPITQSVSLGNQGAYFPKIQEGEFDYLTCIDQQQQEQINRTVQVAATDPATPILLPTSVTRANQLLGFDSFGNPIAAQPSSALVSTALQPFVSSASLAAATALLRYQSAATGSVSRSLAEKLGDFVTVLDFGADATGVNDSLSAFNAALAASKTVYVPPGTYRVSGAITLSQDGNTLIGAGINSTYITTTNTTGNMLTCVLALFIISIRDMTFTRTSTATAGAGIGLVTVNQAVIERVRCTNQWFGFSLGAVAAGSVVNCISDNNRSHGFYQSNDATHNTLQWSLRDCLSQFNDGWGFAVQTTVNTAATSCPLSPWINCTTFANTAGGCVLLGSNTAQIWDFAAVDCWIGSDNGDGYFFDTCGGNHFIRGGQVELCGQVASGRGGTTSPTHIGNGVEITANNNDVSVLGVAMQSISYNGVLCQDNLFTLVSGCVLTQLGLASGNYGGVINAGVGHVTVTGCRIGSLHIGDTSQYGISVADGALLSATGNDLRANSLGAIAMTTNYGQANISGNVGYVSRLGGQVTIPAGATSVTVTHSLSLTAGQTPIQVNVTPLSQLAAGVQVWVSNLTQTTLRINVATSNASDTFFAFSANMSEFN